MRRLPVRGRRSVGVGIRRRGMELRNHPSGASTLCPYREDNTVRSGKRGAHRPTESKTLCMRGHSMSGSRESLEATDEIPASVRLGKVCGRNPSMNAARQSDRPIILKMPSNESLQPETANDRRRWFREVSLAEGNSLWSSTPRTQKRKGRYGEL